MKRVIAFVFLVLLGVSVGGDDYVARLPAVVPGRIDIVSEPVNGLPIHASRRFRFVEGWALSSPASEFGGLSALAAEEGDLVAVTDRGALLRLDGARIHVPVSGTLRPLPPGCADRELKTDRDAESIATNPLTGMFWIGLEWRNAVCEVDGEGQQGRLIRPPSMRNWPRTGGPESMTRLTNGDLVILAERPGDGASETPMLIYRQSILTGQPRVLRYRPPPGYRPTDLAELPDGSLLILNRRFRAPFDFSSILVMTPPLAGAGESPLTGRPLALFQSPGIADNFEALAVDIQGASTQVWIASDDNFVATQKTYLLKFELLPASGRGSVR
jgi:hypothetical protein